MILIQSIFLLLLIAPALLSAYLLTLTLAAWFSNRQAKPTVINQADLARFVILIPAHNEERLLPECLASLVQLDYLTSHYQVLVIADNCQDRTATIARSYGALVTERVNAELRGKGYALNWGMKYLRDSSLVCDAIVILDADTTVSSNFLRAMAAKLALGARVIQAYYSVRSTDRSWSEYLRYTALTVLHYLRPQGRMVLGGSAGLKGNGMVFAREILEKRPWSASITEDIEFHMALLLDGERVLFAPEAIVWGEMPNSLAGARSQADRWEQGRIDMARRYIPRLLHAASYAIRTGQKQRMFILLDAVMEHLIPPFSVMMALSLLTVLAALGLFVAGPTATARISLILACAIFLVQLFYLFSGLILAKAPAAAYQALAYAPLFILWKIWQYLRVLLHHGQHEWVRTTRNGG